MSLRIYTDFNEVLIFSNLRIEQQQKKFVEENTRRVLTEKTKPVIYDAIQVGLSMHKIMESDIMIGISRTNLNGQD